MNTKQPQQLTDTEISKRRDDAVRRALNTPPKPHAEMKVGKKSKRKPSASASKKP